MSFIKSTTLVIPDAHVEPDQDLIRFSKLGNFITEHRPDNIVFLGDFVSLDSLSAWDLGKSGQMEGRRYSEDCKAGIDALHAVLDPIQNLNQRLKNRKERQYHPRKVYCEGNHEERLARYLQTKSELSEHLSIYKDLKLESFGITEFIPYRQMVDIDSILFTHAVQNAANQGVAGKTALGSISQLVAKSVVQGHTHRAETMSFYRHGADDICQVYTAGCFFSHVPDYANGACTSEWVGISLLTHWKENRFDINQFALERLLEEY